MRLLAFLMLLPTTAFAQIRDLNMPLLAAMSSDQRAASYKVPNQAVGPCNRQVTPPGCLPHKPKCRRAQSLARFVGRQVQSGLTTMDIVTQLAEGFPSTATPIKFNKGPAHASKSKPNAKIQIVEFADFRCPHCEEAVKPMQEVV